MNARPNMQIDAIIPFSIFSASYFFNFPVLLSFSGNLNAKLGKNNKISKQIAMVAWMPKKEYVSIPLEAK